MSQVILSTVGTSLLTQQIDRGNTNEKTWYPKLRDAANLTEEQTPKDAHGIIDELSRRATERLMRGTISQIRGASAELNGIYGLYEERLERGKQDLHWLISTATAQGQATAKIVNDFLCTKGLVSQVYTPTNLSTANTQCFFGGHR